MMKDATIQFPDGTKEWRDEEGRRHRIGGPAVITSTGDLEWYLNGELHREDGPAVVSKSLDPGRRKIYWVHGQPCNSLEEVRQKSTSPPRQPVLTVKPSCQEWRLDGLLHRDDDLPAVIWNDGDMEWWSHGRRHRYGDRPAVNTPTQKLWYWYGLVHREGDKPASIRLEQSTAQTVVGDSNSSLHNAGTPAMMEWSILGKHHRDGGEPARISSSGLREWFRNGRMHRDDGLPAIMRDTGESEWYEDGVKKRERVLTAEGMVDVRYLGPKQGSGPCQTFNGEGCFVKTLPSGVEEWFEKDMLHRSDDLPAVTNEVFRSLPQNSSGGVLDSENIHSVKGVLARWYRNGRPHRDGDQPAVITDHVKIWFKDGSPHRDTGPAVIHYHWVEESDGKKCVVDRQEWWFEGKLHRDEDEPAIECLDGSQEWWSHGCRNRPDGKPAVIWMNVDLGGEAQALSPVSSHQPQTSTSGSSHRTDQQVKKSWREWWVNGVRTNTAGPAITYPDGSEEYYVDGERHRDNDLPAIDRKDGTQMWYCHNRLHRIGGMPAVIRPGRKEWMEDGVHHRVDGPAIDDIIEGKHWYINGVEAPEMPEGRTRALSSIEVDLLTKLPPGRSESLPHVTFNVMQYAWYSGGKLHRDGDMPALSSRFGDELTWYQHGRVLRDGDKPSFIDLSYHRLIWHVDGASASASAPSKTVPSCSSEVIGRVGGHPCLIGSEGDMEWKDTPLEEGGRGFDLPAVVGGKGTMEWHDEKGEMGRGGDLPSKISDQLLQWFQSGKKHRMRGPAVDTIYGAPEDKMLTRRMEWRREGELDRQPYTLPCVIEYLVHRGTKVGSPLVGDEKIVRREWYYQHSLHRLDGPAVITPNSEEWYMEGKRHRDGGKPAVKRSDGTREWHVHGKRHRGGGKPAVKLADGTRKWYTKGLLYRRGGPAVIGPNGEIECYIYGKLVSASPPEVDRSLLP